MEFVLLFCIKDFMWRTSNFIFDNHCNILMDLNSIKRKLFRRILSHENKTFFKINRTLFDWNKYISVLIQILAILNYIFKMKVNV